MISRFLMINIEGLGYGGYKKCGVFSGMYFHVCMFCVCFIERIWFYIHGFTTPRASKSQSCELLRFFVCLYVWMFGEPQPGPGARKRSDFTMVSHLRVPPNTTEQKTSPNGLQEYVFMEVLAGSRFEVFEVHTSIHPSIHPSILLMIKH